MQLRDRFVVSVPATSANLGPGFDCVGLALDLRARAMVEPAHRFALEFSGPEQPTQIGFERMLIHAMHTISSELPRVRVHLNNAIPLGKGLGSSAAASALGISDRRARPRPRTLARRHRRTASATSKAIPITRCPPSTAAS